MQTLNWDTAIVRECRRNLHGARFNVFFTRCLHAQWNPGCIQYIHIYSDEISLIILCEDSGTQFQDRHLYKLYFIFAWHLFDMYLLRRYNWHDVECLGLCFPLYLTGTWPETMVFEITYSFTNKVEVMKPTLVTFAKLKSSLFYMRL